MTARERDNPLEYGLDHRHCFHPAHGFVKNAPDVPEGHVLQTCCGCDEPRVVTADKANWRT